MELSGSISIKKNMTIMQLFSHDPGSTQDRALMHITSEFVSEKLKGIIKMEYL
jgi:hypothetical protein